jgi:major vault protein
MVDHLRSLIGNTVRNIGVQEFYTNAVNVLRDTVLGVKDEETGERKLRHFTENGMTVYDLELINITVKDPEVAKLLADSRQATLLDAVKLERAKQQLILVTGTEDANRQIALQQAITKEQSDKLKAEAAAREVETRKAEVEAINSLELLRQENARQAAEIEAKTKALYLETAKAQKDLDQTYAEKEAARKITLLVEEAKAQTTRMQAVNPALVEALVALAQTGQFEAIAEHLAPLSIVRGESLSGTLQSMFAGTPLEGMINNIENLSKVKTAKK